MPKRSTLKLTKRIVEKLKAEDKDAIYWDGELPGFGMRVHGTVSGRHRCHGVRVRRRTSNCAALGLCMDVRRHQISPTTVGHQGSADGSSGRAIALVVRTVH